MKMILTILLLFQAEAYAKTELYLTCASYDGKFEVEMQKASPFKIKVNEGKFFSAARKKSTKKKSEVTEEFASKTGKGKSLRLIVTPVMGEAGHVATLIDGKGSHEVHCHYEPKFEPKP